MDNVKLAITSIIQGNPIRKVPIWDLGSPEDIATLYETIVYDEKNKMWIIMYLLMANFSFAFSKCAKCEINMGEVVLKIWIIPFCYGWWCMLFGILSGLLWLFWISDGLEGMSGA